jgi:hypothetical protein
MRGPLVEVSSRCAINNQAEQFRTAVMAARIHQLFAPIDQGEIDVGNYNAFAGTDGLANQLTFG